MEYLFHTTPSFAEKGSGTYSVAPIHHFVILQRTVIRTYYSKRVIFWNVKKTHHRDLELKCCICAKRAFRLQKTLQRRSKRKKRPNTVQS